MKLAEWRNEIDSIDNEIIKLIDQRMRIAQKIGNLKAKAGLPIIDNHREERVLRNVCSKNQGILDNESVIGIYKKILFESKKIQLDEINSMNKKGVKIY